MGKGVIGDRRRYSESLHDLYCSPDIGVLKSRIMRRAGHVARMGKRQGAYRVWWGEGKRPLGRPGCRREDIFTA